jgi:hypothetical protein
MEALRIAAEMREDGASRDERDAYVAQVLKASWPKTRPRVFDCDECEDTGWRFTVCAPDTPCGRPFRLPPSTNESGYLDWTGQGHCSPHHAYVRHCFCRRGQAHRPALEGKMVAEADVTDAGKRLKGRSFRRLGR